MSSCSTNNFCCPVTCDKNFFPNQPLIAIKRCTPVRSPCDNTTETDIYIAPQPQITPSELASGFISLINTSRDCTITLTVVDEAGTVPYPIIAQDSIIVEVSQLQRMFIVCDGPDPLDFCTGTLEVDLQYISFA
ncbi:S-Ena type endospore appendage [Cytobacillus sp. IB215316]|uniref:S-Ena type endospore appendage n=1 Tax=Cytobacillus sp. IB215316 TaxID=3097354 RepID=UPI002A0DFB64|nr:S-Ena type endospore appendage [Cytobacillus sp. IB215316]MDX8360491.1 S-Ena type endospore appendage [Cytobacillus sp. IB215316]